MNLLRLIKSHKLRPWKGSDQLAKALELTLERLSDIQSIADIKDCWRLAARTRREVEVMIGEDMKH